VRSRHALLSVTVPVVVTALTLLAAPSRTASASGTFGTGTAGFAISSAPSGLHDVDVAGEPSVGIDWRNGSGMFMAATATYRLAFNNATGSVSWTDASAYSGLVQNLDPILVTEPRSGVTLAGGDTGPCSAMFASTDDGASWLPSVPCTGTYDHPTVGWSPSAKTPGATVFYYCQQGPAVQQCQTSTTGGVAWTPSGPLVEPAAPTTSAFVPHTCISAFGHLRGSSDGTAYLPGRDCFKQDGTGGVGGMRTRDDGTTWTQYLIPSATDVIFDPAIATTPDNTLYEAWQNAANNHPVIAVSHDHGATWGATVDLAGTVSGGLVAATFPTLTAGDNGRIAYSFLGTSVGTGSPNADGFHGIWYLYTSYSYDGGATWTTVRDTPDPVQYGFINGGGVGTTNQRNLLDFIESAVTKDGRVVVSFATGCLSDCVAKGAAGDQAGAEALSGTHAWATLAYQTAGKGLFAAYDTP